MRLYRIDHFSYGLDEILQGFWIQGDWAFFWKSLKFDAVHPPLDYLIGRFLEALAPADWARKLPSVSFGVGTIAALAALMTRRTNRITGCLTILLLLFAPFHVRYSQEFRPYSLGLFTMSVAVLCLDRFLESPGVVRLTALFGACLATLYSLYLAGVVLAVAALGLLMEDSFSSDPDRRRAARRFLAWSPVFSAVLFAAYLPWWPVVVEAAKRAPAVAAEPMTWKRVGQTLSFFAFAHDDGVPFGVASAVWTAALLTGAGWALVTRRLRFLLVWFLGGLVTIETLGQIHPHWYATRRFLPAGIVIPALIAVTLARLAGGRRNILVAVTITGILLFDASGLRTYFREGRADWRPLARFLRERPKTERIFTENQYSQLCVAFYLEGPEWLAAHSRLGRAVWNLEGEIVRLTWSWKPNTTAWLVLAGQPQNEALRRWAQPFPSTPFPTAEGADLRRLDPALRNAALAGR